MSKILIISYHFSPLNVVASLRANAYARYLSAHGFTCTVLTEDWTQALGLEPDTALDSLDNLQVIRLKSRGSLLQRIADRVFASSILSKPAAAILSVLGLPEYRVLGFYFKARRWLMAKAREDAFDLVLAVYSPDNHIRLGHFYARKSGRKFIADYRDPPTARPFRTVPGWSFKDEFLDQLKDRYHDYWLKRSCLLLSVTSPWTSALAARYRVPRSLSILNGYDPLEVPRNQSTVNRKEFRLLYAGRVYPQQDLATFVTVVNRWWSSLTTFDKERVVVEFCGICNRGAEEFLSRELLPKAEIQVARVDRDGLFRRYKDASVLLLFDFKIDGVLSGKFCEYIGMMRPVLMLPAGSSYLSREVMRTGVGLATDVQDEAIGWLSSQFNLWRDSGRLEVATRDDIVQEYSRKTQVGHLAIALRELTRQEGQSG